MFTYLYNQFFYSIEQDLMQNQSIDSWQKYRQDFQFNHHDDSHSIYSIDQDLMQNQQIDSWQNCLDLSQHRQKVQINQLMGNEKISSENYQTEKKQFSSIIKTIGQKYQQWILKNPFENKLQALQKIANQMRQNISSFQTKIRTNTDFFIDILCNLENLENHIQKLYQSKIVSEAYVFKQKQIVFCVAQIKNLKLSDLSTEVKDKIIQRFLKKQGMSEGEVSSESTKHLPDFFTGICIDILLKLPQFGGSLEKLKKKYMILTKIYKKVQGKYKLRSSMQKLQNFLKDIEEEIWEKCFSQQYIYKEINDSSRDKNNKRS